MKKTKLAILVPCFNEEEVIQETNKRLLKVLDELIEESKIDKESIIFYVNDGSRDNTWNIIERLSEDDKRVKGISFSRNFGHQNALYAGLMYSKDYVDCVISIDADLQQDEKAIAKFIDKFHEGFEIVNGVRLDRNTDTFFKRFSATLFYKLMKFMGVDIIENSADFRLVSSRVIEELSHFKEVNLFLRGIFPTLGFKTTTVEHEVRDRFAGKSKYSLKKMLLFAVEGITSFSIFPIRVITLIGFISTVFCCFMILYVFFVLIFTDNVVAGWASTVIPLYFLGSIQLLSLGVIGEYIGKIYLESKGRPRYIVDRVIK
ncbi:MAG: Ribonuclease III [candidate division WS6 bacterium 34_10]|uniref:Ribonuclease III n=1 Tax=candidate division WS6 bacterium 34_10 TaxID=1641389 RepID=A0A101HI08_9BACT|nr:MAG: Ribonuclease III [candidate division WS6 bacterium 34_10]